jgi:hypothetical protein
MNCKPIEPVQQEDAYKQNAAAYEHFANLDQPTEEEQAAALREVERQIDRAQEEA